MAANLFSARVITMGTLIAVFLSTSDEMLPIMISEHADILLLIKVLLFKVIIGIIIGFIIDIVYRSNDSKNNDHIHELCEYNGIT